MLLACRLNADNKDSLSVYFGKVGFSGVRGTLKNEINKLLTIKQDQPFDENILKQNIDFILNFLENNGYPLAKINIESVDMEKIKDKVFLNFNLSVDKGEFVRIERIEISGNDLTKYEVVRRETRLKVEEMYSHKKVVAVREILQRLGYFKQVEKPKIFFKDNKAVVRLNIKEGNANTMDGIIGYIPSEQKSKKGYFTGRLQFTFKNLMGTGRFLEAFWEKKDENSQSIRFGYEEPWLFGYPLYAGVWFHQQIRDTTYVERKWNVSLRYQPWSSFSMSFSIGQRNVLPDSAGSVMYNLPKSESWQISASIDYNTLDDPLNPRKGIRYHTALTAGRKRNTGPDFILQSGNLKKNVTVRSINIDVETLIPVFTNQVIYFGLHGREIKTGEEFVNLSDQIRFGGTKTLRGYEEDVFRGSLAAWVNGEYRYILGRHSRVFIFLDSGMFQRVDRDQKKIRGYKIGYGFGIRMETRAGMIGIDYGLGEGDSMMQGKLHVGIISHF